MTLLMLISCGKPKDDGDFPSDQILPRTVVTQTPHQNAQRVKVQCYLETANTGLYPIYLINGTFYQGTFSECDGEFKSCQGNGVYVHYFNGNRSCIAKKGFEEEFTLCMEGKRPQERQSSVGVLIKLDLTIEAENLNLWCNKKILQILLEFN